MSLLIYAQTFYDCFVILGFLSYFIANIPSLPLNDTLWASELFLLLSLCSVFLFSRDQNPG